MFTKKKVFISLNLRLQKVTSQKYPLPIISNTPTLNTLGTHGYKQDPVLEGKFPVITENISYYFGGGVILCTFILLQKHCL